jgi:hypothetical protein
MNPVANTIECVACGSESEDKALGWRAYIDYQENIWIYCPTCDAGDLEDDG